MIRFLVSGKNKNVHKFVDRLREELGSAYNGLVVELPDAYYVQGCTASIKVVASADVNYFDVQKLCTKDFKSLDIAVTVGLVDKFTKPAGCCCVHHTKIPSIHCAVKPIASFSLPILKEDTDLEEDDSLDDFEELEQWEERHACI